MERNSPYTILSEQNGVILCPQVYPVMLQFDNQSPETCDKFGGKHYTRERRYN